MAKFLQLIGTIKRTIFRKVRTETILKIYNTYIFVWVRKLNPKSFTETKNWRDRNEIIETSDRLHPSWPQNKWLYMPWTKDYRHTRQDRGVQTELAFTLAKNATKLNPTEIIPLQTTRKENNWKTKETLVRAVVTLETEWIKLVQSLMFMMTMMMMMNMGIRLYNKIPINIKKLEKYKPHKKELKSFLTDHAFYSVEEFLCCWFDAIAAWTK